MAAPANTSVKIDTDIFNDASKLIIKDKSVWQSEAASVKNVWLSVVSDGALNGYRYDIVKSAGSKTVLNTLIASGLELTPSVFTLNSINSTLTAFPDGLYEISLNVEYGNSSSSAEFYSYTDNQGFIPFLEGELQRQQLPMGGNALDRFANIHIYAYGAKSAGSVGKVGQFTTLVDLMTKWLNNHSISYS